MQNCTQVFNDELGGDNLRRPVAAQIIDLPVARGRSVAAHLNDLTKIEVCQSSAVLQLMNCKDIFHHDSV